MALEEAAKLAEATEGRAVLLSAGSSAVNDTKLVKAALSRGAEELFCVVDDALESADAWQTATALAAALGRMEYDVVLCGEGSSDQYAQQVGPLLGSMLGVPTLNGVSAVTATDGKLRVERTLEDAVEVESVLAPQDAERKHIIYDEVSDEAIAAVASAIKAAR